jgi:dephospho-CoA kinase
MKHTLTVNREVSVTKIALCGKLRSGKDTAANHLYIRHGFDEVAFGDALKRTVNEVFPWMVGPNKPRALLQQYGQLMREIDPQVWIRHVERKVNGIIDFRVNTNAKVIGIVITDLRQPNEYEWARANGFTIIRVTAPDEVRIGRAIQAGDDFNVHDLAHSTELEIDNFTVDYTVENNGTVDELKAKFDAVLEAIG